MDQSQLILYGPQHLRRPTKIDKFVLFTLQLFRTPSFEIIPMELVMGKCIVMDPNTYSKGRPKGFKEQDVYICEYRVDKTAHLFHKIQKIWYEQKNLLRWNRSWFWSESSEGPLVCNHRQIEE